MAALPDRIDLLYDWLGCDEDAGEKLWFGTGPLDKGDSGLREDIIGWAREQARYSSYADHLSEAEQWGCVDRAILEGMMPRTKDPDEQKCWVPYDPPPDMNEYVGFVKGELSYRIHDEMKETYEEEYKGGARDYYHGASKELRRYSNEYSGIEGVEDVHREREKLDKPDEERHDFSVQPSLPDEDVLQQEQRDLAASLVRKLRSELSGKLQTFLSLIIEFLTEHETGDINDPTLEDVAATVLSFLEVEYDRTGDLKEFVVERYADREDVEDPDNLLYQHTYRLRRRKWRQLKEETYQELWQEYIETFQS